jgi:membrane-associated protein
MMDLLRKLADIALHLDAHLAETVSEYGTWTYLILVLIVFCETGLVVTPILPGDSLLFAAGAIAATGALDVHVVFVLLCVAAIAGDTVNYWIGSRVGPRAFRSNSRLFKREHLLRTQEFYERHGGKTIILARFVPIVRTFAPFVAGIGSMSYAKFIRYNILGGRAWAGGFVYAGYFFGSHPFVKKHFGVVVLAIIAISLLPFVWEFVRARRHQNDKLGDTAATSDTE